MRGHVRATPLHARGCAVRVASCSACVYVPPARPARPPSPITRVAPRSRPRVPPRVASTTGATVYCCHA
eukprot:496144-Pleurochrysis_carterae.AAC.1